MSNVLEVQAFLEAFKVKLEIWDLFFYSNRQKNTQTLADLEIRVPEVKRVLKELGLTDFCEGPIPDKMLNGADLWVFGKQIKGHEIYIKITLGIFNQSVICISFHFSEYPLDYPFQD